jgi:hypothetical protein
MPAAMSSRARRAAQLCKVTFASAAVTLSASPWRTAIIVLLKCHGKQNKSFNCPRQTGKQSCWDSRKSRGRQTQTPHEDVKSGGSSALSGVLVQLRDENMHL